MKVYEPKAIRNVAIVAHGGAGKTSLAEALLYVGGATHKLGSVDDETSHFDFEPEEVGHKLTLNTSVFPVEYKDVKVNVVDTPGDQSFQYDALNAIRACDAAILVISASDGVQVGAQAVYEAATEAGVPVVIFVNKLDREHAEFQSALDDIAESLGARPSVMTMPIGKEADLKGVVDVLALASYSTADGKETGPSDEVPDDLKETVEGLRSELIENIAESDDALVEKYLGGEELSDEEISRGLVAGMQSGSVVPVLAGSAKTVVGVTGLLDFVVRNVPSPVDRGAWKASDGDGNEAERKPDAGEPFSAFVFKTTVDPFAGKLSLFRIVSGTLPGSGNVHNFEKKSDERYTSLYVVKGKELEQVDKAMAGDIVAIGKLKETSTGDTLCDAKKQAQYQGVVQFPDTVLSYAMNTKKGEEDKIGAALSRIRDEDPSLVVGHDEMTKKITISGVGQRHIEITLERLKRKFNLEVQLEDPKIPYRETIRKTASGQGRYKKQTGGKGQFGDCWLEISPLPRGSGYEFEDAIVGGAIPRGFIPAVDKGVQEAMSGGVIAGYPVVDIKIKCFDGSYHTVDSSEMAFKIAGSMAFKKIFDEAKPVLLEPIMKMKIVVPEDAVGDVMGDINHRRGRVQGIDPKGKNQIVNAEVPMAEVLRYSGDLNSMTGGRGSFTMKFEKYEEVPSQIADKIIAASQAAKAEE